MANPAFLQAIGPLLEDEGGLVDDPRDPGGLTNFGIALRRHPELDADDIREMTAAKATEIYLEQYWTPYRWCDLAIPLGIKCFNLSVVDGAQSAIRALQRACWAAGERVGEDGVLGTETLRVAGSLVTREVLSALRSELAAHFRILVASQPLKSVFLQGWLARAYR